MIYTDKIFKDEDGRYFSGEYLDHNPWFKSHHTFTEIDEYDKYEEMRGRVVRCNYSQLFYPDTRMILCNEIPNVFPDIIDTMEQGSLTDDDDTPKVGDSVYHYETGKNGNIAKITEGDDGETRYDIELNDGTAISNVEEDDFEINENDDDENFPEIYQWYIIDDGTAEFLLEHTEELLFYCEALDLHILGVTHWGTGWDYVDAECRW